MKSSYHRKETPPTTNISNQPAIDAQIEAYDICKNIGDDEHRHGFNNAINSLRLCETLIDIIETANQF